MLSKKLNAREIAQLWIIWEGEAGESFMDYCGDDYVFKNISFLLGYWSVKFPKLYKYLMDLTNGSVPWKYPQDGLEEKVETFYSYNPSDRDSTEEDYLKTILPWTSLIADNEYYYERFERWMFAETDDERTQYDQCKEEFEEWMRLNSTK